VQNNSIDIRESIFASVKGRTFAATLTAMAPGVLAGISSANAHAECLGIHLTWHQTESACMIPGALIARVEGSAHALAIGEERLLGCLCKASGIATAARRAVVLAAGRIRVVSGSWKKMPPELKMLVRHAIAAGGMPSRITDGPFIYLDKNYVRMLGGITATLQAVQALDGVKVIQVRGEEAPVAQETRLACRAGAGVVMVDTGQRQDAVEALTVAHEFPNVQVAFAGGVQLEQIPVLADLGLDILDIGVPIVDAPLLEIKLDAVWQEL
jgi:nicotinate-nucleotide pyrophosphorylase (carboxylating)